MFPLSPSMWGAIGVALLVAGLGAAVKFQTSRLDACKAESAAFVAKVEAEGQIAAEAAKKRELSDLQAKKRADDENARAKRDLAGIYAAYRGLRDQRNAGSGSMPAAPAVTSGASRTCFDSAKFARAMGVLETGVPGITEQGDAARLRLSGAAEWAKSVGSR